MSKRSKESNYVSDDSNGEQSTEPLDHTYTIVDHFKVQAQSTPEHTALIEGQRKLTFNELDDRSNQLAQYLISKEITKGTAVGIAIPRSINMVIGLLGALKAGAIYVPLDPSHPPERLELMINDAEVSLVITTQPIANRLPLNDVSTLFIDALEFDKWPAEPPSIPLNAEDNFIISFTSGSTGRPKGVLGNYRAYLNRFKWFYDSYPFEENESFCQKTTLNFVDHIAELWAPLLKGHTLIIATDEVVKDGFKFIDLLEEHAIKRITMVPSYLKLLLETHKDLDSRLPHLNTWTVSGEKLTQSLVDRFHAALPGRTLLNLYGMSEASADVTYFDSNWGHSAETYPIGRPIANMAVYLLNEELEHVADGESGEMFVSGHGLSHGYFGRDDLTAERFIPNPFENPPHPLMYRTGDLGRRQSDGVLEFVGRVDNQVKIRGIRIELEEVEDGIRSLPTVQDVVVTAQELNEDNQLIAYVIPTDGSADISANTILEALANKLPEYMLPARVMLIEAFPLTPNGKINRKALSETKQSRPKLDTAFVAPRTALEKEVAAIWGSLLGINTIGSEDDFFDLGGDSLMVVRLRSQLSDHFEVPLAAHDLFECRTVSRLASRIKLYQSGDEPLPLENEPGTSATSSERVTDIAVIGMAGRFPGAENISEFWHNLTSGIEGVRRLTEEELIEGELDYESKKDDPDYVPVAGLLENIEYFDADFFNIHPIEARSLDPQQRLWFETAWETLENAGYTPEKESRPIGVFAGSYMNGYLLHNLLPNRESMEQFVRVQDPEAFMHMLNNEKDYMPTKTSHLFDLKGPSINVQTACSTSLVAISLACQSIQHGDCDMALAGGVSIFLPDKQGYFYQQGGIRAKDGHCKPFDAEGSGTIFSSGLGCVMLKRLDLAVNDNDNILAVIKGSAMNNDGANKASYTAPSIDGQVDVIRKAQRRAGINAETIGYIEAHGTATPLGDPIEIAALTKAFGNKTAKKQFSAIGSVKSNIGHLDAAAGVAGFIKAVLTLKNELIPPTLHYTEPNPEIDFENSPFYVNNTPIAWPAGEQPRRAGVSSFGIGGTNAHVVLEEAPTLNPSGESRPKQLILLSAKTESALAQKRLDLANYLEQQAPSLPDTAFTLVMGRSEFAHRQVIVVNDLEDAIEKLRAKNAGHTAELTSARPEVVMMFPGQGSQFVGMGKELFDSEPLYRDLILRCSNILEPMLELNLVDILYPKDENNPQAAEQLTQTGLAQPAIFMVSYALAKVWQSWGVEPDILVGHSVGEYVAAALSGVFSLDEALAIIAYRARLMQSLPSGSMRAIRLPAAELEGHLGQGVTLAAANAPGLSVVSGPTPAMDAFVDRLKTQEIETIPLHTSHAFHSEMMDPILEDFTRIVDGANRNAPKIHIVSTRTGDDLHEDEATDPNYWARQLRDPVLFSHAAGHLLDTPGRVYLEVGPGNTLSNSMLQHRENNEAQSRPRVVNSLGHPKLALPALEPMLTGLGQLWLAGVDIDWPAFYAAENRHRIPLPTYPFERKRFWVDALKTTKSTTTSTPQVRQVTELEVVEEFEPILQENETSLVDELATLISDFAGVEISSADYDTTFLELGFDSLLLTQVSTNLKKTYKVSVPFRDLLGDVSTLERLAEFCESSDSFVPKAAPIIRQLQPTVQPIASQQEIASVHTLRAENEVINQLAEHQLKLQETIGQQQEALNHLLAQQANIQAMLTSLMGQNLGSPQASNNLDTQAQISEFPLTADQLGIWFNSHLSPEASSAYNVAQLIHLNGPLNRELFLEAVNQTFLAHDSYHIEFDGVAYQQTIAEERTFETDFRDVSESLIPETTFNNLIVQESTKPFGLSTGPVARACLVKTSDSQHTLIYVAHHIITDGWSCGILLDEIHGRYSAALEGSTYDASSIQSYSEFVASHVEIAESETGKANLDYWADRMAQLPDPLVLPADKPRPDVKSYGGDLYHHDLDARLTDQLRQAAIESNVTLPSFLLAAFKAYLFRLSQQDDLIVGVPMAGQTLYNMPTTTGFLVHYMPVRTTLSASMPFAEYVARVQDQLFESREHQPCALGDIIQKVSPPTDLSRVPITDIAFNFDRTMVVDPIDGLTMKAALPARKSSAWDIFLNLTDTNEILELDCEYNTDIFLPETIAQRVRGFETFLRAIVLDQKQPLGKISMLSAEEREQILFTWNKTVADFQDDTTLHALFDEQANSTPDSTALIFDGNKMSYAELQKRANQLAHHLIELGVKTEVQVGISIPRSFEMIIALLATIKAGGVYVPLDPNYPKDRIELIVEDAEVGLILTMQDVADLYSDSNAKTIVLDSFEYDSFPADSPESGSGPDNSLFITFTSGSTGRPKGVQIHHKGMLNRLQWQWDTFPLKPDEICCQKTTLNFVDHLWEIWGTLLNGNPLVLIPDEVIKNGNDFVEILNQYKIERIVLVPSFVRLLFDIYPDLASRLPHLKLWTLSGEGISRDLADRFRNQLPEAVLLNFYGMSEITADATWYDDRWGTDCETIPIGKPISNMQVYILDKQMEPVPIGVPGEIYVGGVGLSHGYHGRPELTAERFFENHLSTISGNRIYKSGDLGRWLPEGQIEYLGRSDYQVKIRGFRIEVGEVEAAIRDIEDVSEVVVVDREFKNEKILVAFIIPAANGSLTTADVQAVTKSKLPDYMVPTHFQFMNEFPKTPNGKTNRRALPDLKPEQLGNSQANYIAPSTPIEIELSEFWGTLLEIERISTDENFFEIGGHSLTAVRLFSLIHQNFGINLTIGTLFETPTIQELSKKIESMLPEDSPFLTGIKKPHETRTGWTPLVRIQKGNGENPLYCIHGGGGNVLNFYTLAKLLGKEQTVFGLQAQGVDGTSTPLETIEEMAKSYIEAIQEIQPNGPYQLIGYSGGGMIAFEIAQQFEALGVEVSLLGLLDTFTPNLQERGLTFREHLEWMHEKGTRNYIVERLQNILNRAKENSDKENSPSSAVLSHEERESILFQSFLGAVDRYCPTPYSGRAVLFRGKEIWQIHDHYPDDYHWRDCIPDLEITWVEGDHLTMLDEENVALLAQELKSRLA